MSTHNETDVMDPADYALTPENQPGMFDVPGATGATATDHQTGQGATVSDYDGPVTYQDRRGLTEIEKATQDAEMVQMYQASDRYDIRAVSARFRVSFGVVQSVLKRHGAVGGEHQTTGDTLPMVADAGQDSVEDAEDRDNPGTSSPDLQEHAPETMAENTGTTRADVLAARRATTPEDLPDGPEREVFTHSPATRAVWHAARARQVSPWAVLGYVMAHTVTATGPHLQGPPLVGGAASLNLLVGLVGVPGAGKGAAGRAARSLFVYAHHAGEPVEVPTLSMGSGEGIAETFKIRTRQRDDGDDETYQDVDRALFDDTEISSIEAKAGRRGSTLLPMLCKAYMGEDVGNTNGTAESSRTVPEHTYRMSLTVGIQPDRAGTLLDDVGGGTPQRFVWLPVAYPPMPSAEDTPRDPEVFTIRLPFGTTHGSSPMTVSLPESAVVEICRARVASGRGEAVAGGMDGHLLLTREKVAVALALMDGRTNVTDAEWSVAGSIIALSVRTREMCRAACKGAAVDAATARRVADAESRDQAADAMSEKYARTVREKVLRLLQDTGGTRMDYQTLYRSMSGSKASDGQSQKDRLPGVLQTLTEDGLIQSAESRDGHGAETVAYWSAPQ